MTKNVKSLNIPKGQAESVRRKTGNTMAKRQKDRQHNGQKEKDRKETTIYKALHKQIKIRKGRK